jgi:hypothetical protein
MGSKKAIESTEKVAEDVAKIASIANLIKECGEVKIKLEELLDKQVSFIEKVNAPFTREVVSIVAKIPRITVTYTGIEETGEQEATIRMYYDKCPEIVMHFHNESIVYYPLCELTIARAVELLLYEKRYKLLTKLMEKLKKAYEGMKEVAELAERLVAVSSIINA